MKDQILSRSLKVIFMAVLVAILTTNLNPAQTVLAGNAATTTTSDLTVRVISMPRRVKACQTFTATFSVKNRGPNPASHIHTIVLLPDPFGVINLQGAPESLAVGKTVTFTAEIKVVAFVPGESRVWQIGIYAMSDPYPDSSIDPNRDNSDAFRTIRLINDPVDICP